MTTASYGPPHPDSRPAWPRLIECEDDRIVVVGTHRCFARRVWFHRAVKALARTLMVYNALALAAVVVSLWLADPAKAVGVKVATWHAFAIESVVRHFYQGGDFGMRIVYFFVPLAVGAILRWSLPAVDLLAAPLTRRRTKVTVTPTEIVVHGFLGAGTRQYARGGMRVVFKAVQHPRLDRIRREMERRSQARERRLRSAQLRQSAKDRQAQQSLADSLERLEREEQRWLSWHEDMRYLSLEVGTRVVRIAGFVQPEPAEDFALVCQAALCEGGVC